MGRGGRSKRAKKKAKKKNTTSQKNSVPAKSNGGCARSSVKNCDGQSQGQPSKQSSFNPSTVNNREDGDEDLTLMDVSLSTATPPGSDTIVKLDAPAVPQFSTENAFSAVSKHDGRDRSRVTQAFVTISNSTRSLVELYEERADLRLSNIEENTLDLAGQAVKQVVFEATHEFVMRCIPLADQERVWAQVLANACTTDDEHQRGHFACTPESLVDLRDGRRSFDLLIKNCIHTLSCTFSTSNPRALRSVFNRAIVLCDALDDLYRRDALIHALNTLEWLILGLEIKTIDVYKSINQELDSIRARWQSSPHIVDRLDAAQERQRSELDILKCHKLTYDKSKTPFRAGFLRTLQNLIMVKKDG